MKITLVKKEKELGNTMSFFWRTNGNIEWLPGQYFYYTLPKLKYVDPRGPTRQFTTSSSPTEKLLRLTTKITDSGFKKTLISLPVKSTLQCEGPNGLMTFSANDESKRHIFLAGGIGVAPFRAIIKYNIDKNLGTQMHLIYSNSDSNFIFKKELTEWSKQFDFIKVHFHESSKLGRLNKNNIGNVIKFKINTKNDAFWACGPSEFVYSMESIIDMYNIAPENKHIEIFTGYV